MNQSRAAGQHITILHVTSATMPVRHGTTYVQVPCLASYQITATGEEHVTPSPHVIFGLMGLALCAVGLIVTIDLWTRKAVRQARFWDELPWWVRAYRTVNGHPFEWLSEFCRDYTHDLMSVVRERQPEQRTREEAAGLDFADGLDIAEAVAAVPELDLDGTQEFPAVFHDDAPARVVPTLVLGDGSYVGLPRTLDVPRPGALATELATPGPGYLPHAGPPAWRPRHARTSWVDELITEALGAPTVEIYMWNWQQRHRLAITA